MKHKGIDGGPHKRWSMWFNSTDQHAAVNTFSGLVHTARHTMRAGNTRSRWPNRKEGAVEGRAGDWGQVVTRYPYENVGMDHLLSKEKEKYRRDDQRQIV